jgi:DNA adenine methylase
MITRPILRYYGGKFRIAQWIISYFPAHTCYIEPFGGAASVLMQKPRSRSEVYNDINGRIVNVFRVLRDKKLSVELQRRCELTPYARSEFEWSYEPPVDKIDDAHKMIFLSFAGFGSNSITLDQSTVFRTRRYTNQKSAANDWANYPGQIALFTERLKGVLIEKSSDAKEIMQRFDGPKTLHYVDPPYVHSSRSSQHHGYRHEMSDKQHTELAEFLHNLQGMVIISGYDCKLYRDLFSGWRQINRKALADGARKRIESIWLSPNIKNHMLF